MKVILLDVSAAKLINVDVNYVIICPIGAVHMIVFIPIMFKRVKTLFRSTVACKNPTRYNTQAGHHISGVFIITMSGWVNGLKSVISDPPVSGGGR